MEKLIFRYKDKIIESGHKTIICGIVNVTPDSFSDGGKWYGKVEAIKHALELIEDGATMLDIGGESTRPGSTPVSVEDEIKRIIPVIKELKNLTDIPISVDTWKAEVAQAAIDAGADIINDITGFLGDPNMAKVVSKSDVGFISMFNPTIARPDHPSSKTFPKFGENNIFNKEEFDEMLKAPIEETMLSYFKKSIEIAKSFGIEEDRIMLDPGIGFGLTKKENLSLIKNIDIIHKLGYQIFLGVSRKRFIVNILSEVGFDMSQKEDGFFDNKDLGSAQLSAIAAFMGVEVIRVHTIKEHLMATTIGDSVRLASFMEDLNFEGYQNKK
ncbi:MAG: dihydropteroate synthase [Peptoniphilaceae bacterium]